MIAIAVAIYILFVISAVTCHQIAKRKGLKPILWGFTGAVIGPLAIPFVLMAKPPE